MTDSDIEDQNSSTQNYDGDGDDGNEEKFSVYSAHADVWRHLRSDITYKSSSDAKLASLFLNENHFPVDMFAQIFDVIHDPTFKPEEVTFKNLQGVFEYISEHRSQAAETRMAEDPSPPQGSSTDQGVPPAVVNLVVDRMIKDQLPLGVAAMEQHWRDAYEAHVCNFHDMSLVHRSWTPIARRALRRRVVVSFAKMDKFLFSPFCGPWVEEMVFYWDVRTGKRGVIEGDIILFEAILKRVPALHSLAFNTCHVWPKKDLYYGGMWQDDNEQPIFGVNNCLGLIAKLLPNLENLYLKHFRGSLRTETVIKTTQPVTIDRTLDYCPEIPNLLSYLPQMHSLKLLSMRRWTCTKKINRKEDPAPALKTIELANLDKEANTYEWLFKSQGEFKPTALSIDLRDYEPKFQDIAAIPSGLEKLQIFTDNSQTCSTILSRCEKLTGLVLSMSTVQEDTELPPTLEYLEIHFHESIRIAVTYYTKVIGKQLESLPRLRTLVLTEAPSISLDQPMTGVADGFMFHMPLSVDLSEAATKGLTRICERRGVELIIQYATCTPRCDRYFLRHGEPKPDKDPDEDNRRMGYAIADMMLGKEK